MAVDFYFNPATFSIPALGPLRDFRWNNIPHPDVAEVIAREEQYLCFHRFVLKNVKHTRAGRLAAPPYEYGLGLSVRAGAIKAALLVSASIAEAALRSHGERRGYRLHSDPHRRTFGNVLNAWRTSRRRPKRDVRHIWSELQNLRDTRNNVHLFKAAGDPTTDFENVLADERRLIGGALTVVDELALLVSP